ncbi:hypothetical protein L218DRAFT_1059448 [Marasmius fiardii PR-910]|nr:hypothetical protein L218DRAFT_1059448 [Marasmius fiardii PR-910]
MGCQWLKDNIFDAQGEDGSTLGKTLLDAIDTTDNMVWADRPMNQAKSNVASNTRIDRANPPQEQNIDGIKDFTRDQRLILNIELFTRSFAALGQYFGTTSQIFRDTAERVQNALSEVTPNTVPDNTQSIPMMFNRWLTGVVRDYPNGCTSRAQNVWGYYAEQMELVAEEEQIQVPSCFPLYHTYGSLTSGGLGLPFNPSSFTYQNLIPPFPSHPGCNVPGTEGEVGFFAGGSNTFTSYSTGQRVMGAGNTNYYAMGSGDRIAPGESRWRAIEFSSLGGSVPPACANAYVLSDFDPDNPQGPQLESEDAYVDFACGGNTGKRNANFGFVHASGQSLACTKYETGHPGGTTYTIVCATNPQTALNCASAAGGNPAPVQMAFVPN